MPTIPANIQTRDLSSLAGRLGAAWDLLRGRPFGPGEPLTATDPQPTPRQFQYPFAVNSQITPRREYGSLTPFEQLRNLAAIYDVAAIAIATRIEELQGLKWAVVAKDKKQQAREQSICDEIAAFWNKPDQLMDWSAWLSMLLYDLFTIDAPAVYKRPAQGGGLYGLEIIDGATIKPLLDDRGRSVAYQQIINGRVEGEWSCDELLYTPRWVRSFTPYGMPPTEWIILRINMAIRKQTKDLAWFTDGNVPEGFMSPPDGFQDPKQTQQFEEMFNADLQGEDRARARIKFLPWNGKYTPTKPFSYTTAIDEWMLKLSCAAFGVTPSELGFTNDVNRATAGMQENVTYRRGLGPLCMWLKRTHFDPIIQNDFGQRQLEMRPDFGESEDRERTASSDKTYHEIGAISADEIRVMRFGDDLDGPAPGPPQPAQPQVPVAAPNVQVHQPDTTKREIVIKYTCGVVSGHEHTSEVEAQACINRHIAKAGTVTHANAGHTGVMVACFLPTKAAGALYSAAQAIEGEVTSIDELHLTLAFLGDSADLAPHKASLLQLVEELANGTRPLDGTINGIGRFMNSESDGGNAFYASFDCPALPSFRQALVNILKDHQIPVVENHGYTPHITLSYVPSDAPTPDLRLPEQPLTLPTLSVGWGDEHHHFPMAGTAKLAKAAEAGPDWTQREAHEQQAQQTIAAAFAAQLKRIVAIIKANPDSSMEQALATAWHAEPELFANDVLAIFDDIAAAGAQEGLHYLTVGADWSQVNEAVLQLAQERARQFAVESTDASKRQIALLTARWIAGGGTLDQLLERVARVYPGHRAEAEAITQVTQLYADANVAAWRAAGYVWGYRWNTANDEIVRQCPTCWPRHKKTFALDDPNGQPPGHYRCRCWLTPVLEAPQP